MKIQTDKFCEETYAMWNAGELIFSFKGPREEI